MAGFLSVIARLAGRSEDQPRELLLIERPLRPRAPDDTDEPRFRTSATDRSDEEETTGRRLRIREAFIPSQPVSTLNMFAGRRELLRQLIHATEDQRAHIVLYGKRGIGKTSLLRVFTEIAENAGYLVVHENCGAATEFDELFRTICARVPLLYHGATSPSDAQALEGGTLADLLPATAVGPRQVGRTLAELSGTRFIVILDEFDRAEGAEFQGKVAELIKNLSDASARVQLLIAGVAQNLQDLLLHSPSIRRNVIAVGVERMNDDDIAEIISIGERHSDLSFHPGARSAIVKDAHGFPYLARLLAHHASMAALASGSSEIRQDDVAAAVSHTIAEMEARLPPRAQAAVRDWVAREPRKMHEIARAGLDGGGASFGPAEIALRSESSPEQVRGVLEELARAGQLVVRYADEPDRYSLNEEEGLVGYLLLATTGGAATRA